MVYDKNGRSLSNIFSVNGKEIQRAYDLNGKLIFEGGSAPSTDSVELTIMTFNPQWFTGINSQLDMLNDIFTTYNPDIIGFQEYYKTSSIPAVAESALSGYPYKYKSTIATNPNGIVSKVPITNVQSIQYTYYDDEKWVYQKAKVVVDNKELTVYNTHLTWRAASTEGRRLQAAELFADAQSESNVIITGDFNTYARNVEHADYINVFKPFFDAGYNLANASPTAGFTGTYCGYTSASSLSDMEAPCDNIIVSSNISIQEVWFDLTKLDYLNGSYIDHIPVVAKILVN